MRFTPKSTRRRAITMIVLLLLMPVTVAMALRAQAQLRDFEAARQLYVTSEQSIHNRDYPLAISQLEESVRLCPDLLAAWDSLALCYRAIDQEKKAYQTLEHACELHPNRGELRRALGFMYLRDQKFELAVVELDRASLIDPTDPLTPRLRKRALEGVEAHKRPSAP